MNFNKNKTPNCVVYQDKEKIFFCYSSKELRHICPQEKLQKIKSLTANSDPLGGTIKICEAEVDITNHYNKLTKKLNELKNLSLFIF